MESRSSARTILLTITAAVLFALAWPQACPTAASPPATRPNLLLVSAPTDADARVIGAWYDQHIPARFRARQAVSVSLLTDRDMTVYLQSEVTDQGADADAGDIDGVFENGPPTITLRLPPDGVPDARVFAHEYGHYVWFDLLSGGDRKRYRGIYDRQKSAGSLVSDYAGDSVEEGFAEAFAYDVGRPAVLARRDPLSYVFLAQWPGRVTPAHG